MSRLIHPRLGIWVVLLLVGLIPYCVGANGCLPVTTPQDSGDSGDGGDSGDTGQPVPTVNNAPNVVFSAPAANSSFAVGDTVVVTFSANDPENDFNWQLYQDTDGVFNGNEMLIQGGSRTGSSLVQAIWSTQGLVGGKYYLWAQVTDSGGNTDRASVGPLTLVSASTSGLIQVTSPASSVAVGVGGTVNIVFAASNPPAGSTINVFYDTDDTYANGVAGIISPFLSSTATSAVWNTTGMATGVYFIGASLGSDAGGRVAAYAPGQVTLTDATTDVTDEADLTGVELTVTSPAGYTQVKQGAALNIKFTAKDPAGLATVDLYYVQVDEFGATPTYTGSEPKIVTGLPVTATSYNWVTTGVAPGVYRVGGTIGRTTTTRLPNLAPGKVQITTSADDGGGGGDDEPPTATYALTITKPDTTVLVPLSGWTTVAYTATKTVDGNVTDATGSMQWYYALDNDKDHNGSWVKFTPILGTYVVPMYIGLSGGTYAIRGIFTPNDGNDPVEAVASGWIEVGSYISMDDIGYGLIDGAVFEGVNYYDLAGSSMTPVADMDGDGIDDFVIVSQFGKPGWDDFGVEGASVGEAYVIYGGNYLIGQRWKLNATGVLGINDDGEVDYTDGLPGLVLSGVSWADNPLNPPSPGDRGGITGVITIPDQDNDGVPELVLGFPRVNSTMRTVLTKEGQFLSGGYVEISSRNFLFGNRLTRHKDGGRDYYLASVGMVHEGSWHRTSIDYEDFWGCKPATDQNGDPIEGDCSVHCVKRDFRYRYPGTTLLKDDECEDEDPVCNETVVDHGVGFRKTLADAIAYIDWDKPNCDQPGYIQYDQNPNISGMCDSIHTPGYDELSTGFSTNNFVEPYGLRLIGEEVDSWFGYSLSWVGDMLLVGAPHQQQYGDTNGYAYRLQLRDGINALDPQYGDDLGDASNVRPYQYTANRSNHGNCRTHQGTSWGSPTRYFYNTASSNAGRSQEQMGYAISGVADLNGDALGDIVIGAPGAFADKRGAVYIVYRRTTSLDEDRNLADIELGVLEQGRRIGVMIRGRSGEGFGTVVGTGADLNGDGITEKLDFDHDGRADLVLGNPNYANGRGEVVIVYGNPDLQSPTGGYSIDDLVTLKLGTVIRGESGSGKAGYNVSYAGDFDGDGWKDLLVSAPEASVDEDGDGQVDLTKVGKVYLILGANRIARGSVLDLSEVGKSIRGLVFVGRHDNAMLGGGEVVPYANDPVNGLGSTGMRARSLSWAGDVNADDYDDILVAAPLASAGEDLSNAVTRGGEVYLIFGFEVP